MKAVITIDVEKLINALTGLTSEDYTLEYVRESDFQKGESIKELQKKELTQGNNNNDILNKLENIVSGIRVEDKKDKSATYLKTVQVMKKFNIGSQSTVLELFRTKGSPAFKSGKGWMVDEIEFREYLKKRSESDKG
jgi:hypothetical protein